MLPERSGWPNWLYCEIYFQWAFWAKIDRAMSACIVSNALAWQYDYSP